MNIKEKIDRLLCILIFRLLHSRLKKDTPHQTGANLALAMRKPEGVTMDVIFMVATLMVDIGEVPVAGKEDYFTGLCQHFDALNMLKPSRNKK